MTMLIVLDAPSAYNTTLRRSSLHQMKVVPSTYLKKIKFLVKMVMLTLLGKSQIAIKEKIVSS